MLGRLQGVGLGTCIVAQEGPFRGVRDPLPDTDGLGVARVSTLCLLIETPVPVTEALGCGFSLGRRGWTGAFSLWGRGCSPVLLEEEGVACGFPPDGRVDAVIGDAQAIAGQWLRVAGLQVRFSEEPVAVTCRSGRWVRMGLGLGGGAWGGTGNPILSPQIHSHPRPHSSHTHALSFSLSLSPHTHRIIHTLAHRTGTDPYTHPRQHTTQFTCMSYTLGTHGHLRHTH